ncbi:MBL fold metallo-hydrolase [Falsibacillus pallidus]|uniref:MBL fold metallo-hydrolase n=1 Tax=Falsibacillus pallidus TaxID=493781 RepID=UPI003D96835A
MKVEKISTHIWSLKTWMIIPIHVWLVKDKDEVTLVDAGISTMAKGVLKQVDAIGLGQLKRIVLTHGHSDHTGSIEKIRKELDIPVYVHSIEIPYMEGDLAYPGRKKAAASVKKGIVEGLPLGEDGELASIGGLIPYLTPGHSPGHVVYFHKEDGVLLAGDLFTSKKGKLNRPMPMFTADMKTAINSSQILRELNPARVEVCHGDAVINPASQLDEYIRKFG